MCVCMYMCLCVCYLCVWGEGGLVGVYVCAFTFMTMLNLENSKLSQNSLCGPLNMGFQNFENYYFAGPLFLFYICLKFICKQEVLLHKTQGQRRPCQLLRNEFDINPRTLHCQITLSNTYLCRVFQRSNGKHLGQNRDRSGSLRVRVNLSKIVFFYQQFSL